MRIHVTGGPGSGKSTLAQRLGTLTGITVHDLDAIGLDLLAAHPGMDVASWVAAQAVMVEALADGDRWITEGAYIGWIGPLLGRADVVVCMETTAWVASYRIVRRHLQRSLARNNRFPGLRQLARFTKGAHRFYRDANAHELNVYGTPITLSRLREGLDPYEGKVLHCASAREAEALLRRIENAVVSS